MASNVAHARVARQRKPAGDRALTRALGAFVFEVSTLDPVMLGVASAAVAVLALTACWLPARRAARIDAAAALRSE